MEEIKENSVSEQENVADSNNYIEALKEMKLNTVSKDKFLKLKEENKQLVDALVNGGNISVQSQEEEESEQDLREKLYGKNIQEQNSLEYVQNVLKLREKVIERTGQDPAVGKGQHCNPTQADYDEANHTAQVLQECVDIANGDPVTFNNEIRRRLK